MVTIEKLFIDLKTHRLESMLSRPAGPSKGACVFCHPHPHHGGDMYNKVVVKTAEVLLEERFAVLRFNMRGVGRSTGEMPDHETAREDLAAVMQWMMERSGPLVLAGYSYGAFIALSYLASEEPLPVGRILCIAYPASMPGYHLSRMPDVPMRFVHGTRDELVPAVQMKQFLRTYRKDQSVVWVEGANHTFDGKLEELKEACRL